MNTKNDQMTYLVQDRDGTWRERDEKDTNWEATLSDIRAGEFNQVRRVIEFNTAEGTSRDVSEDIARDIQQRAIWNGDRLSFETRSFIHEHAPDLMPADYLQAAE